MRTPQAALALAILAGGLVFLAVPAADPPGTIRGKVHYTGAPPVLQRFRTTDGTWIEHYDLVVEPKTKGLRDVAVILEDAPAQAKVKDAKRVIVDQRDMIYIPRVVAVQHGQEVRFENSDLCNHSVMTETVTRANQFNYFVGPGSPIDRAFELQKGPVKIGCALHAWMRAWIYVVPHPWFALTNEKGQFQIANVPAGKYTLLLAHADTGVQERKSVTVEPGKALELAIDWNKTKPD
jgi:plastocyanin